MINRSFLIFLGVIASTTVFFSLFNHPSIRGFRNLGILAAYVGTIVGGFVIGWTGALTGWAIFGVGSGLIYFIYELISLAKSDETEGPKLRLLLDGLMAWPIMLPEAIEYSLADMGVLKTPELPSTNYDPDEQDDV